jgi:predicted methyltransferase
MGFPRRLLGSLAPVVLALTACNAGPTPKDASSPAVRITSAHVALLNDHTVDEVTPTPAVRAILGEPDRSARDRSEDAPRQAASFMTLLDVEPGMRVAELESGTGYTTELLARSVGPGGVVFAQNEPALLGHPEAEREWEARLARPADANVRRVDRSIASPLPAEARALDLVILGAPYARIERRAVDVDAMNHAVHLALRPGGRYVVLVRTPLEGDRRLDMHALHAQISQHVRESVESAGFTFLEEARIFRDSSDASDWDATPDEGQRPAGEKIDRFVLVFARP